MISCGPVSILISYRYRLQHRLSCQLQEEGEESFHQESKFLFWVTSTIQVRKWYAEVGFILQDVDNSWHIHVGKIVPKEGILQHLLDGWRVAYL